MDIINLSFLSSAFSDTKRKIYSNLNINQSDSKESSPEKTKRKKKRKEEDFIQLCQDSDDLEEISPSIAKKLKSEEEKEFTRMKKILVVGEKIKNYKKKRSSKKRNNSSININNLIKIKEEKEENQPESESLNEKKTFTRKKSSLYQSYTILEEEQNEDEDNNINTIDENNSNLSNWNSLNKYNSYSKDGSKNLGQLFSKRMHLSKSHEHKKHGKRRSKLLDSIHNLSKIIDVYLFNTGDSIKINIRPTDTVKEIKTKIILELKNKRYNIPSDITDAYDLRVLDEPDESPDLDIPPLRDYVRVSGLMPKALIFLNNSEFSENSINTSSVVSGSFNFSREKSFDSGSNQKNIKNIFLSSFQMKLSKEIILFEDEDKNGPKKYEVKVYYKDIEEENNIKCENIFLNAEDTLRNILYFFFAKNLLIIKNENLYFFITHNSEEDFENGYNLDITINSLTPPYELDLCYKYFPDLPQPLNLYQLSVNKNKVEKKIKELSM